jgi:hypothetical protein
MTTFVVPTTLFFYTYAPHLSWFQWNLFLLLDLAIATSYAYVSFADPGFCPSCTDGDLRYLLRQQGILLNDRDPLPPEMMLRPGLVRTPVLHHLCPVCNIYCPPRTIHCVDCDVCCEGFDHHCPFVGNCIGAQNHTVFAGLLSSSLIFLLFMLWTVVYTPLPDWVTWIFLTYTSGMLLLVGGFASYHFLLFWNGLTTREHLRPSEHESSC